MYAHCCVIFLYKIPYWLSDGANTLLAELKAFGHASALYPAPKPVSQLTLVLSIVRKFKESSFSLECTRQKNCILWQRRDLKESYSPAACHCVKKILTIPILYMYGNNNNKGDRGNAWPSLSIGSKILFFGLALLCHVNLDENPFISEDVLFWY